MGVGVEAGFISVVATFRSGNDVFFHMYIYIYHETIRYFHLTQRQNRVEGNGVHREIKRGSASGARHG